MRALLLNLNAGMRLVFLLPLQAGRLRMSIGQFWLLCALSALSSLASDWILTEPPREFNPFGLWEEALFLLLICVSAYLLARLSAAPNLQMQLPFFLLAAVPFVLLIATLLLLLARRYLPETDVAQPLAIAVLGWWWLALWRAQGLCTTLPPLRRGVQAALMLGIIVAPDLVYVQSGYWQTAWREPAPLEPAPEGPPPLNAEQVFFDQPGLLAEGLRSVMPEAAGQPDLFIIGFAGYGEQDVFRREIEYLGRVADNPLKSGLRFMPLINHRETLHRTPLASLTNLEAAIESMGRMMNPDEDVLMLYLTSHGTEDHQIAVELGNLPLHPVTPESLHKALDHARVRWKILVISACFSGGYLHTLSDPDTLVITAARADRHSFGCENEADLTWFGRAFLEDGLALGLGFERAFAQAETRIHAWELNEGLEHSEPQIHLGSAIRGKLAEMELL